MACGIKIIGYLNAESGIGEVARLLIRAIEEAQIPYSTQIFSRTASRKNHPFLEKKDCIDSKVNLICINADQMPHFVKKADPSFFKESRNIGVWFWELEEFPTKYLASLNYVDEIWVASDFTRNALSKLTSKPIYTFPLPILPMDQETSLYRSSLGIPLDRYLFLYCFDFFSIFNRKNPLGLIKAFKKAFAPNEGPFLLIKSINGKKHYLKLRKLYKEARGRSDIFILDQYFSNKEKNELMNLCDAYISLHRAEGFGLTLAEAMSLGKPVIGTHYSGNLTFMNQENSFLCPYELMPVGRGSAPYPSHAVWGEPNLEEAAKLMRYVVKNPKEAQCRGKRAQEELQKSHSLLNTVAFIQKRWEEIHAASV